MAVAKAAAYREGSKAMALKEAKKQLVKLLVTARELKVAEKVMPVCKEEDDLDDVNSKVESLNLHIVRLQVWVRH